MIAGAGVAAVALIGGGVFLAAGLGGGSSTEATAATSSLSAAPTPSSSAAAVKTTPSPTPTPVTTVTATATVTAAAPVVEEPAPNYSVAITTSPPTGYSTYGSGTTSSSGPNFGYEWRGSVAGRENGNQVMYTSQLVLTQDSSGYVSGKAYLTSSNGNTGAYTVSGQVQGNQVVLNPVSWINKPNDTWNMDVITLSKNGGGTVTASYVDQSAPDHAWGTTTLS